MWRPRPSTFFRAVGGSVGVALFGALFTHHLTGMLGGAAPAGLTPADIGGLPADQQALLAGAFAESITLVFLYAVPVLVAGFLLSWLLRETPLRTVSAEASRAAAVDAPADALAGGPADAPAESPVPAPAPVAYADEPLVAVVEPAFVLD